MIGERVRRRGGGRGRALWRGRWLEEEVPVVSVVPIWMRYWAKDHLEVCENRDGCGAGAAGIGGIEWEVGSV